MGRAEDLFRKLSTEGEAAIDALILDRQSEELFLDFKRSADNGAGPKLNENDRRNLAKAISGFGNSAGGVLLWGIERDIAAAKVLIQDPKRFVNWLESKVSGCTLPPHAGVRHAAIEIPGTNTGFVATLVPESARAPHQCLVGSAYYYIRAGSDFVPAPHGILARLFGQSPQPFVFHTWQLAPPKIENLAAPGKPKILSARLEVGFGLVTRGPGVARDLYVTAQVVPPGGHPETRAWFDIPDQQRWQGSYAFGRILGVVSIDGVKLPPEQPIQPVVLGFRLVPPFTSGLTYSITFGHGASPVRNVSQTVSAEVIAQAFETLITAGGESDQERPFARAVLGLKKPQEQGPEYYDLV